VTVPYHHLNAAPRVNARTSAGCLQSHVEVALHDHSWQVAGLQPYAAGLHGTAASTASSRHYRCCMVLLPATWQMQCGVCSGCCVGGRQSYTCFACGFRTPGDGTYLLIPDDGAYTFWKLHYWYFRGTYRWAAEIVVWPPVITSCRLQLACLSLACPGSACMMIFIVNEKRIADAQMQSKCTKTQHSHG
jgi:hypothetical protein